MQSVAYRDATVFKDHLGHLEVYDTGGKASTIDHVVSRGGNASNNFSIHRGICGDSVAVTSAILKKNTASSGLGMLNLESAQMMLLERDLGDLPQAVEPLSELLLSSTLAVQDGSKAGFVDTRQAGHKAGYDRTFLTNGATDGLAVSESFTSVVNRPWLRGGDAKGKGIVVYHNTGAKSGQMAFAQAIRIDAFDVHLTPAKGLDAVEFQEGERNAERGVGRLALLAWTHEAVTVVFADATSGEKLYETACVLEPGTIVMSAHLSRSHSDPGSIFANVKTRSLSGFVFHVRDPASSGTPSGIVEVRPMAADPAEDDGDIDGMPDLLPGGALWQNVLAWGADADDRANGLMVVYGPGSNSLVRTWVP